MSAPPVGRTPLAGARGQAGIDPRERTRRWPALLVLSAVVALAIVVQARQDDRAVEVSAVPVGALMPAAAAAGAPSSTWYCAGGSATGTAEGVAEQTVEIANLSDEALTARVTAVPSEGESVAREVAVGARSRVSVVLSTLVVAPWASATVEVDGGELAVAHVLTGPTGTTTAACSSSPSASWYLPSGGSLPATRQLLAVFNPFPSEAVVGVTFETDDGARTPQDFGSIVVPGGRVTVLDVSAVVTLRREIATTVLVRSGRVVVDQIQTADGTQDTIASLTVTPGAPQASPTWWFPDGPAGADERTSFAVQNPSDHDVDVELQVRLDDAAANGEVEPFPVTVLAGRYAVVDVSADGRVPVGVGYTAVVTSRDATPIVATRVSSVAAESPSTGTTVSLGSPAVASRWFVPVASVPSATSAAVVVTNPSSTAPVTVTLSVVADGSDSPIPEMQDVVVAAGGRGGFALPEVGGDVLRSIEVVASAPVVVEARVVFDDAGLAAPLAVPVLDSASAATSGLPPPAAPDAPLPPDPSAPLDPSDSSPSDSDPIAPDATDGGAADTSPSDSAPPG